MQTNYLPYTFIKGNIVKTEEATVPIMTNALQYGTAIFGGIRGYYNEQEKFLSVFRIEDHYTRFLNSLKILGVNIKYSKEELIKITLDLIDKNKPQSDTYFRPFAYASSTNLGPNLDQDLEFDFSLYMLPLGEYLPINSGLKAMVSSWRRISDNAIPARGKVSGAYINSALARQEAKINGYDEAILLTEQGLVAEGSAENIFIVKNNTLITPPETDNILEGITRKTILQLAEDLGIKTQVRSISRTELYTCDEAFFSGTGVQISWISSIDNRSIASGERGPITGQIQDLYFKIVKGQEDKYKDWCSIIKVDNI
jgi:branched-chain amino acid aminotransferase